MKNKNVLVLLAIALLTVTAGFYSFPQALTKLGYDGAFGKPFKFGLDIVGGAQLTYEVDMAQVDSGDRDSVMNGLRDVIERRINLFGVSEPHIVTAKSGDSHRLLVELAGVRNVADAINEIGLTPLLDFREVNQLPASSSASASSSEPQFQYVPTKLTGRFIKRAQLGFEQQGVQEPIVFLEFDEEGSKLFEEITARNINKNVAIFLDNQLISAPVVREKISGGRAQISGRFTVDEARALVERFNAGALPAPIHLVSQQTIAATLGEQALGVGVSAGVLGTLAIIIFMLVYYRTLGIFASVALIIYTLLTLAIFKFIPVTLTLAGIAGFILSIGMAIDANILIFERTREEIAKGASRASAIEEGFKRAWTSIRDSNVSTVITSLVLYFFTTSIVKGFALTLLIGVVISMFSAITITRTMLRVFLRK